MTAARSAASLIAHRQEGVHAMAQCQIVASQCRDLVAQLLDRAHHRRYQFAIIQTEGALAIRVAPD